MIAKAEQPLKLTEKQEAFSVNMFTYGLETFGNGTESARQAKYKGNDNTLGMTASRLIRNDKIIARKQQIQAITTQKVDYSRDKCLELLVNTANNAVKESDSNKAISIIGDFCGYKTDNAPNPHKIAQQAIRTAEDAKLLQEIANEIMLRKAKSIDCKVLDERKEDV